MTFSHSRAPPEAIERRYDEINAFEKLLADNGTKILKFMLNISKEEQAELLARARREIAAERERAVAELRRETVDLSLAAASKLIGERLKPDLVLIPIGGHFTMDPADAAEFAEDRIIVVQPAADRAVTQPLRIAFGSVLLATQILKRS